MTEKLKPCPFCGGEAELTKHLNDLYSVQCNTTECYMEVGLCTGGFTSSLYAIKAWNRRAK